MTVWVAGNAPRALTRDLMTQIGAEKGQNDRRGLKVPSYVVSSLLILLKYAPQVDDKMRVIGADGIWAIGDCAISQYPATAQVLLPFRSSPCSSHFFLSHLITLLIAALTTSTYPCLLHLGGFTRGRLSRSSIQSCCQGNARTEQVGTNLALTLTLIRNTRLI